MQCQENAVPAAVTAAASARKVSQNYAIYAIYVARGATLLGRHKDTRVNQSTQTERKREREAATHLAPVALRAWQCLPPLSLFLLPSAAAHLIFGNINLLTTYTTCCAAMRRFCCFCHVFSPSLSLPLSLCLLAIGQLQLQQLLLCMLQALHPKLAQLLLLLLVLLTKCIRFRTDSAVR